MPKRGEPVAPKSLNDAIAHLEHGGTLYVQTYIRTTVITQTTLLKFRKVGGWLLREDGDGYRLQTGKTSVYLFPGQLKYA